MQISNIARNKKYSEDYNFIHLMNKKVQNKNNYSISKTLNGL